MVLSSQRNRGGPGRLYASAGKRRRGSKAWLWIGLIVLAMLVGYRWMVRDESAGGDVRMASAAATAPRDPSGTADSTAAAPAQTQAPTPGPNQPPPTPSLTFDSRAIRDDRGAAAAASSAPTAPAPRVNPRTSQTADPLPRQPSAEPSLPAPPPLGQVPVTSMPAASDAPASQRLREGMALVERGQLVQARAMLSDLLFDQRQPLSARDAQSARDVLTSVNESLVFSDRISPGDPLIDAYTVQSGDILVRIAPRYRITHRLIERINNVDARRLRVGQKLKVVKGPFHAVVHKAAFRMDMYLKGADGQRVYIRSFRVGLGENDSTPVGLWRVRAGSKLVNPGWTHPRTNEYFAPDNPANPIGEHWIGLEGMDENTRGRSGYGLHGTIEPQSVGRMMSLGCVRLLAEDIAAAFDLLVEEHSTVEVLP